MLDGGQEQVGRGRHVDDATMADTLLILDRLHLLLEVGVAVSRRDVELPIKQPRRELAPMFVRHRTGSHMPVDRLVHLGPKRFVGLLAASNPDDRRVVGEIAVAPEIEQRGKEFSRSEVSRRAEDDDRCGLGMRGITSGSGGCDGRVLGSHGVPSRRDKRERARC